jgi:AcrR family transcriptional regulator
MVKLDDRPSEEQALSKGERTTRRILDAAEVQFARYGYEAASLRTVAAEVGIREPGLYRHFANKEHLYHCVLERGLRPLADKLDDMLKQQSLSLEAVAQLPAEIFSLLVEYPNTSALFQQALLRPDFPGSSAITDWLQNLLNKGAQVLHHAGIKVNHQEAALRILNMFNLCTGFFASRELFQQLTGKDALDPEVVRHQQRLLGQIAGSWR